MKSLALQEPRLVRLATELRKPYEDFDWDTHLRVESRSNAGPWATRYARPLSRMTGSVVIGVTASIAMLL